MGQKVGGLSPHLWEALAPPSAATDLITLNPYRFSIQRVLRMLSDFVEVPTT